MAGEVRMMFGGKEVGTLKTISAADVRPSVEDVGRSIAGLIRRSLEVEMRSVRMPTFQPEQLLEAMPATFDVEVTKTKQVRPYPRGRKPKTRRLRKKWAKLYHTEEKTVYRNCRITEVTTEPAEGSKINVTMVATPSVQAIEISTSFTL